MKIIHLPAYILGDKEIASLVSRITEVDNNSDSGSNDVSRRAVEELLSELDRRGATVALMPDGTFKRG